MGDKSRMGSAGYYGNIFEPKEESRLTSRKEKK